MGVQTLAVQRLNTIGRLLLLGGCWIITPWSFQGKWVQAQMIPDTTLGVNNGSTVNDGVTSDNIPAQLIEGGLQQDANLFHSFSEFNIGANESIYFANPEDVNFIFTRVTGGNSSNILGTLGVDGPANFYLLNPAGVMFGETANLDVQGSVLVTTEPALFFEDGSTFATDGTSSLLTVSVPLGLQYQADTNVATDQIGPAITSQATLVTPDTITLIADTLDIQGVLAANTGITLQGTNIEVGGRLITGDTRDQMNNNSGDVTIQAGGRARIRGNGSGIDTSSSRALEIGSILIESPDIRILNGADLISTTRGLGTGGDITLRANGGSVSIRSTNNNDLVMLASGSGTRGTGNAGNIEIVGNDVEIRNHVEILSGGFVDAEGNTENNSTHGNAGNISITSQETNLKIRDNVVIRSASTHQGASGNISLIAETANINLRDTVNVIASITNSGEGNAGEILLEGQSIFLRDQVRVRARSQGNGSGGDIRITAEDNIILDGTENEVEVSGAIQNNGSGERAGNVVLSSNGTIEIINATAQANSVGQGNAANVTLQAADFIRIQGPETRILSRINSSATGNGGTITISADQIEVADQVFITASIAGNGQAGNVVFQTRQLDILNEARIASQAVGSGNGGKIIINAPGGRVRLANNSSLESGVDDSSSGNGGNIEIDTGSLVITGGSRIVANTIGVNPTVFLAELSATDYPGVVQREQPLLYWSLNEDSGIQITDESGNGFGGTVLGPITLSESGIADTAIRFNQNNGILERSPSDIPSIEIGNSSWTIEAWVKLDANPTADQTYLSLHSGNRNQESLSLGVINTSGAIRLGFTSPRDDGEYQQTVTSAPGLIQADGNTWHHIVVRYDADPENSGSRFFLDGARQAAQSRFGPFRGSAPTLHIGSWISETQQEFNGVIDEVAIYNEVLTAEEILSHYLVGQQSLTGIPATIDSTGSAQAGNIIINADTISISGQSSEANSSGLFASSEGQFSGDGGNITVQAHQLSLSEGATISARSQGTGNAGNVAINLTGELSLQNGDIITASEQTSGGEILIRANSIRLLEDGDIRTDIATGQETGGDITLQANNIVALGDSDILAFSEDGRGGNINLDTPAFFGENFSVSSIGIDPSTLDGNNRVDVNASGRIQSGTITLPDVSVVQNTLTTLPDNLLNPDVLVAGSCVVRAQTTEGSFMISGAGGLPQSPNLSSTDYPTGTVQRLTPETEPSILNSETSQTDVPISEVVEPQGIYQLADGRLVLSKECL